MQKKKTMGSNPLQEYLAAKKQPKETRSVEQENSVDRQKKERITIHLSAVLIDRIKNVVFWEPGLTLTEFAEEALAQAVTDREKKRGAAYPARKERTLKSGRPVR